MIIILPGTINLNKILALSPINNIAWIMIRVIISIKLFFLFLMLYMFILRGFIVLYKTYSINIFIQINSMNFLDKLILIMLFISLGGLPPLLGFLRKFLIVKFILYNLNIFLLYLLFLDLFTCYIFISLVCIFF